MAVANYMTAPQVRTANATSGRTTPATQPRDGMLSTQVMPQTSTSKVGYVPGQIGSGPGPTTYGGNTQQSPQWSAPQFKPPTNNPNNSYAGNPPSFKPFAPPTFNPSYSGQMPPRTPSNPQGALGQLLGGDPNIYKPSAYIDNDAMTPNYLSQTIPLAQLQQNAYQYAQDSNQAANQFNATHGLQVNQNQYQQALSTQQQQMAEQVAQWQQGNFQQQFGHTQNMDYAGLGLSQQEINNQYAIGMGQNQVGLHQANQQLAGQLGSAGMYSQAQIHEANQQLAGTQYQANQNLAGQLGSANIYAGAQNHAANQQLAGQLGSANIYSQGGVQEAQLGLQGTLGAANMGLQGQLGSAGMYSQAQRYQADQEMAAAKYQWDMQMRMNQAMMRNNLQVANTQAYGRSQAPNMQWARSWA
jgi:hypothetical protein